MTKVSKVGRPTKHKDELENTFVDKFVTVLIPQFEELASLKPKEREEPKSNKLNGWRKLAAITAKEMMLYYPDDRPDAEKEYATCWSQIGKLNDGLLRSAYDLAEDKQLVGGIKTIVKHFTKALYQSFSVYKQNTTARYRREVFERSLEENQIELDMSEYIKQAHNVLETTTTGLQPRWEDVSCALALVTGRRMAEIHLSAVFEPVEDDEYSVMFTGQLKGGDRKAAFNNGGLFDGEGKEVRYVPFIIPTLVKSELVISGLKYLSDDGKRLAKSEPTVRVNARYSKELSKAVKERWSFIEWNADTYGFELPDKLKTTYHKFRSAYFLLALENTAPNVTRTKIPQLITRILGDSSKDAQEAYDRFTIKPDSITSI